MPVNWNGIICRYIVDSSNPTDNCLMSNVHLHAMDFYTDLEPDRNYDVYTVEHDSRVCSSVVPDDHPHVSDGMIIEYRKVWSIWSLFIFTDCFWRVKSGFTFPQEMVRISLAVKNLGQCQYKCIHSKDFICRSFVFRWIQFFFMNIFNMNKMYTFGIQIVIITA